MWIDTLRADSLGCYGYNRNTSPNIDLVANNSYLFMDHHTPHTVTLSSFMSIITGLYPFSHGVLDIAKDTLSSKVKTLAEILKMHGYSTSWFGPLDDPHLDPDVGFGRGFDKIDIFGTETYSTEKEAVFKGLRNGTRKVLKEIEMKKDQQFFINFHSYHVHAPYIPSEKYRHKFTKPKQLGIIDNYGKLDEVTVNKIKKAIESKKGEIYDILQPRPAAELERSQPFAENYEKSINNILHFLKEEEQLYKYETIYSKVYNNSLTIENQESRDYIRALYDAGIFEFDVKVIGPLIAKLKKLKIYDETMIIICSDHGEEFGEHGFLGHGYNLYKESTHVPLIIKLPYQKEGKKINAMSQTVDILPTILGLLNIAPPYYLQGKDFSSILQQKGSFIPREYIFGQMPYHRSVRNNEWKLQIFTGYNDLPNFSKEIRELSSGKKELFNMYRDPAEKHNEIQTHKTIADNLFNKLDQWTKSLPTFQDVESEFRPNVDKQTQERIKKTGYW
ncbi:MAG: sulfatase [Bacteroidetes bacterium]|nr:sulfatase [Bacteroidota bacterium]